MDRQDLLRILEEADTLPGKRHPLSIFRDQHLQRSAPVPVAPPAVLSMSKKIAAACLALVLAAILPSGKAEADRDPRQRGPSELDAFLWPGADRKSVV